MFRRKRGSVARIVRLNCAGERAFVVAGEGDEAGGEFREFIPAQSTLAFGRAEMAAGDEAAEILVTEARFDHDGENGSIFHGEFRADDRADAGLLRLRVKPGRAVDAIAISERYSGHAEFSGDFDNVFRKGGTAQEAEGTASVEFDIRRRGAHGHPRTSDSKKWEDSVMTRVARVAWCSFGPFPNLNRRERSKWRRF